MTFNLLKTINDDDQNHHPLAQQENEMEREDFQSNDDSNNSNSSQTEFHENPLRSYDGWWWFLPEQHGTDSSVTFTANDVLKKYATTPTSTTNSSSKKNGFVVDKKKFSVTLPISTLNISSGTTDTIENTSSNSKASPISPSVTMGINFPEDPYHSSTWSPFSTFDVDRLEEAFQRGDPNWDSCCDVPIGTSNTATISSSIKHERKNSLSVYDRTGQRLSKVHLPSLKMSPLYWPGKERPVRRSKWMRMKSCIVSNIAIPTTTETTSTTKNYHRLMAPLSTMGIIIPDSKNNNKATSFHGDDIQGGVPVPINWEECLEDWFEKNSSIPQTEISEGREKWIPLNGALQGYSILVRKGKSDSTYLMLQTHPDEECFTPTPTDSPTPTPTDSPTPTPTDSPSPQRRTFRKPLPPIRLIRGYLPYHIALVGALKSVEQAQCSNSNSNKKNNSNHHLPNTSSTPYPMAPTSNTLLIDLPSPFDPVIKGYLPPVPKALVIAVHGIGQKMAINSGQSNFIRECRQISNGIMEALDRRDYVRSSSSKSSPILGEKSDNKDNIYVLPVNWRRSLKMLSGYFACDEEMVYSQNANLPSEDEDINEDIDEDISSLYSKKNLKKNTAPPPILAFDELVSLITLDSIPFVREYCSDVGADILLYMTPAYFKVILSTVIEEIRKIWRIFVEVNGGLHRVIEASPNISLMGHSLGCAIISDLLAFTIDKNGGDASSTATMHPREEVEIVKEKSAAISRKLGFSVDNFFALGSPLAMFFVLKQWRPVGCFPLPEEDVPWNIGIDVDDDDVVDDGNNCVSSSILSASPSEDFNLPPPPSLKTNTQNLCDSVIVTPKRVAFACRSYYNVFHPHDPIAYRVEPLVLGPRETHLNYRHPMVLPYTKNGMISIKRQVEEKISLLSNGISRYKDDFINQVTSSFDSLPNWIKSKVISSPLMTSVGSTSKENLRYSDVSLPPGIKSITDVYGNGNTSCSSLNNINNSSSSGSGSSCDEGPEPFLLVKKYSNTSRMSNPAIMKNPPLTRADRLADAALKRANIGKERLLKFNRWGRTDFMVEEPLFEHQYYSLLSSHFIYWYDADIASFIMEEIFPE